MCQHASWPKHREQCIPRLVMASAKAAKEKKNNSLTEGDVLQAGHFPDPGSKVKISHVAHDKMFIYHVERGPNGEPNQFETLIKRCIEKSRQVKSHFTVQPKVNDIVFAPFEDEFYRAIVKEIKGNKALIFYPDFGNSETMEWSMLKEIPDPNIKYANTFTHPVWIDNISEFTAPIREFLQTLIDEQEFILTTVIDVPKTSIKMVDMRHVQEKYILSTKLLTIPGNKTEDRKPIVSCPPLAKKIQTATKFVVPNPETYKRVGVEELKELEINEGKGMELIIVNASQAFEENLLTVVHKSHLSQYETLLRDCQHYGKIDKNPYEPDNDEACLIQLCEFWHRAIYIEPSDITGGQFYLLDDATCTNMETVSSIRRYPPAMSRKLFVLEGVLENAQNLLKSIDGNKQNVNMLPGKTLKADLHLSKDDELGETTHITVLSID
ncbi:uncharacterized protein LOC128722106 [Anopheles nili]|uniref:uncharacterized protein LOC128722106 n=1 Tax=Anopheles nili TaxID=185578 RepID=UPI00237B8A17|nr:uncharacterized protein LOC128722106 [Anopheles nili]